MLKPKSYHIAVVGATGAVGAELLGVLERRGFPVERLLPLSSNRSAGKTVSFRNRDLAAEELSPGSFKGIDLAFFSAGGDTSRRYAPVARAAGAIVIDNSSVFRLEPNVPLVIPEINGEDVQQDLPEPHELVAVLGHERHALAADRVEVLERTAGPYFGELVHEERA